MCLFLFNGLMKGVCTFLYWHLDFIWIWSSILYSSSSFPFVSWDAVLELGLDSKLSLEFLSDMTLTTWVSMVVWGYGAPFITDNFLLFAILNFHLLWLSFPFNCFLFPVLTYAVASSLYFFFIVSLLVISLYIYIFFPPWKSKFVRIESNVEPPDDVFLCLYT